MEDSLLYVVCSLLIFTCFHPVSCTQEEEQASNAVKLVFYRVSVSSWKSGNNMEKLASKVSTRANSYCASNPKTCGMTSCCTPAFKGADIGTAVGYPRSDDNEKDLLLRVYINLPANATLDPQYSLSFVVKRDVTGDIIGAARDDIFTETGYYITFIDETFYGIAPADLENKIIIPIAFVVLLAIIVVAFVLYFQRKRRDEIARRQKLFEKRKTTKVGPVRHVLKNEEKLSNQPPPRNNNVITEDASAPGYKTKKPIADSQTQKTTSRDRFVTDDSARFIPEMEVVQSVAPEAKLARPQEYSDDSFKDVQKQKKKKKKKEKHSKRNKDGYKNMDSYDRPLEKGELDENPKTVNMATTEL